MRLISVLSLRAVLWSGWLGAQVLIHVPLTLPHRRGHGRLGISFIHLKSPLLLQIHTTSSALKRTSSILITRKANKRVIYAAMVMGADMAMGGCAARAPNTYVLTSLQGCPRQKVLPAGLMCNHVWQFLPVRLRVFMCQHMKQVLPECRIILLEAVVLG